MSAAPVCHKAVRFYTADTDKTHDNDGRMMMMIDADDNDDNHDESDSELKIHQ